MTAKPFINTAFKFGLPILVVGAAFSGSSAHAASEVIIGNAGGTCNPGNIKVSEFTFGDATTPFTLANILQAGNYGVCHSDDKKYIFKSASLANLNPTLSDPFSFLSTDKFEIKQNDLIHTLFVSATPNNVFTPPNPNGINTGTYQLTYDVLITSDLTYELYGTTESSAPIQGTPISAVKILAEATYGSVCDATNASCGTLPGFKVVPDGVKKFDFVSTLVVAGPYQGLGTGATAFDDSIRQKTSVPGPLPVLGALSAFGFARKIRKRYKLA